MKRFLIFFSITISVSLVASGDVLAQNISQVLADLKKEMGEITIDKTTYTQSIEVLDEQKGKIKYVSVAVNDKGVSTKSAYEFYVSDIDKNTLLRKPSGKKFFVSLWLNNRQKFIKYFKDDKLESYTDNLEILVLGADIAQKVIDLLKTAIPLVKNTEKTWNSATEALNWLKANIGEVTEKTGSRQQTFSFNNDNTNLLELTVKTTGTKGDATEEKYNWNITDLNKNKLSVKVSGTILNVALEIKNGEKYIQYLKNNELQNFVSAIEIASDDIDHARNVIAAFSTAFDRSKPKTPEFKTPQTAVEFMKNHVGEASTDQKNMKQSMEFTAPPVKCSFNLAEADSKGKTVNHQYEFYLTDADPNVTFKVSGKKILIPVQMSGENKYVRYTRDNVLQNYTNSFEIYQSDIEAARDLVAALNKAIKGIPETSIKFSGVPEAMKFLQSNIEGSTIGSEQYQVSFEGKTTEPFASVYSVNKTDAKGATNEESYLFYPYLLDVNNIKVESDGKYLTVISQVSGKKSFVKKIKKDQNSFVSEISIMSFDVKKAKDIANALRFLSANTTPKPKTFANKQAALEFVKQNTGTLTLSGKTIKQSIEAANDNPCKLTLTTTTTDDKGKTTEQVFEFTLLDINKNVVDFKPSGANISLVLSCKNKQKLIKAYKDGEQQSFATDVELLYEDIEVAKNVSDALKYAIGTCE